MNARSPADAVTDTSAPAHGEYRQHALHRDERVWLETNCYVDLWIELLHHYGCDPHAALSFTVTQDFEGDQFTFPKFSLDDIARLYGLQAQELAIYDTVEAHVVEQTKRGQIVVAEMDSYWLPDTRATAYRQTHTKTTIAIDAIDAQAKHITYFHNAGYFSLSGEDYDGVFRLTPGLASDVQALFPYVEFVKRARDPLQGEALVQRSVELLKLRLQDRPASNPVAQWRAAFPEHMRAMLERDPAYYHLYTFNMMRQIGSNFELLSKYLGWLNAHGVDVPGEIQASAQAIASEAMVMQFRLARARMRSRTDLCEDCLGSMQTSYDKVIEPLAARFL
ncbi:MULTISPECIES: DUF1839 family protein [unclassified Caballeronia]|uniref:DUF1839 family protein n=1 Tax=unclassified Caballeronia TaxID=2646786 RepID=UPI002857B7F5|nr:MULTISPECIES: DUF1839 family protein [unclassified Caballeronia]MDR5816867.1 DUF1839 family protein [Caballeronia sp. LZ033]MDR5823777.1 DUF1839 family protein [Caballeronia sp. LZ043]